MVWSNEVMRSNEQLNNNYSWKCSAKVQLAPVESFIGEGSKQKTSQNTVL